MTGCIAGVRTSSKCLTYIGPEMERGYPQSPPRKARMGSRVCAAACDSSELSPQRPFSGIISALAFCSDYSGVYAAGTYSSTSSSIALFDPDVGTGSSPTMYLEGVIPGGVTQIQFHPSQPHIIFAASRRSGFIQRWDLRNPTAPLEPSMFRGDQKTSGTNQRMSFDVDLGGQFLAAGNEVVSLHVSGSLQCVHISILGYLQSGSISLFNASPGSETTDASLTYQAHDGALYYLPFHSLVDISF